MKSSLDLTFLDLCLFGQSETGSSRSVRSRWGSWHHVCADFKQMVGQSVSFCTTVSRSKVQDGEILLQVSPRFCFHSDLWTTISALSYFINKMALPVDREHAIFLPPLRAQISGTRR